MQAEQTYAFVDALWEESILPVLADYIRIPNTSPLFDPDWEARGHMDRAVALLADWCRRQPIEGLRLEVLRAPGRTPLFCIEIPGTRPGTVLLYGHLDKQPEMVGWSEGLGPWQPVRRGDRLYGRGGADDGYAVFASLAAIGALQQQGIAHARCVVLIEASEESGSPDLPAWMARLAPTIGTPELVVCLDSGCGNYAQLWVTTSLRGLVAGNLVVELLREGVHSGDAGGVVADGFRVARVLLSRLEDEASGRVHAAFHAPIPAGRVEQAARAAEALGDAVYTKFPFHDGVRPVAGEPTELVLNRTWRPALAITGAAGLPELGAAGNVCRPLTALKLSLRLPPTLDAEAASTRLAALLETDPPYGARVRFEPEKAGSGWNAPALAPWLAQVLDAASNAWFGQPAAFMGEGGSIPFMGMLGERFPDAQFVVTGVLGPASNAHGPNEFLHIPTAKKLSCCIARVLAEHAAR